MGQIQTFSDDKIANSKIIKTHMVSGSNAGFYILKKIKIKNLYLIIGFIISISSITWITIDYRMILTKSLKWEKVV